MGHTRTRQPGRRPRGDRTRDALVDAALALFGERGVEMTSVDEITAAAAVAKGTFYVHFQRKQDVLLEHAARLVGPLERTAFDGAVHDALAALSMRVAADMTAMPRPLTARMMREILGHRDDWMRVLGDRKMLSGIIQPLLERGQDAGEVRTDLSARRLAQALTILWLDTIIGWSERPQRRPLQEELQRVTSLFLEGARGG